MLVINCTSKLFELEDVYFVKMILFSIETLFSLLCYFLATPT